MTTQTPPETEGRVARRQKRNRSALIAAASRIMSEKGIDAATMLEIAELADVGIGASLGSSVAGKAIDTGGYHAGFWVVVASAAVAALIAVGSYRTLRRLTAADVQDPVPATA